MKTIREKKTGLVRRVPDFQARALVESGAAVFATKAEWKRIRGVSIPPAKGPR